MNALENFVSPALMRALGWTLLHSLWQGALVAAVLAGALLLLRRQRAEVRYVASAGALGVVVALAGITFGLYFNAGPKQQNLLTPGAVKSSMVSPAKPKAKPTTVARPIRLAQAGAVKIRAARSAASGFQLNWRRWASRACCARVPGPAARLRATLPTGLWRGSAISTSTCRCWWWAGCWACWP
ncbi:hypothetical protein ACFQT0_10905 [Hymenobacter humi]|uniref:Uncharacterized protein n=1 Tax=Hymenobacter humi TaxID=1411620 RepID=A0ABW2U5U4_9BACT